MKLVLRSFCLLGILMLSGFGLTRAQPTSITTGLPNSASSLAGTNPGISFVITNNNSYPIILQTMDVYRASNQNGLTFTLKYSPTSLSGTPNVTAWTVVGTATASAVSSTGIHPTFSNLNFTIPANTTYRFAVQNSGSSLNYGGSSTTPNSFSNGGVTLGRGSYQINSANVGYSGGNGNLTITPRFFCGTITFVNGSANNLEALMVSQPTPNSSVCYSTALPVRVVFKNAGSQPQSNFQIGANYSGPSSGTVTGMYTGTIQPGDTDSLDLILSNVQPGNYVLTGFTMLSTDTLNSNDTAAAVMFQLLPPVAGPTTYSDTVCVGNDAVLTVDVQPSSQYRWYSSLNDPNPVHVGNSLTFSPLVQDTTLYVASVTSGCESTREAIHAAFGPPPVLNLGNDTAFCESSPLVLDAGNPGGIYTWSTGDTTQSISITNQSGTYWVVVDKYCLASDTIDVNIAPMPSANGISFVRMNNTYYFTATNPEHIDNYYWIFGDGATSSLPDPTHTYDLSITTPTNVMLIISNNCGSDTIGRIIPTSISGLEVNDPSFTIYPNPASTELNVKAAVRMDQLLVMNTVGTVVHRQVLGGLKNTSVDLSRLASGSYFIVVATEEGNLKQRFQIVR